MKINNADVLQKIHAETLALLTSRGLRGWNMDDVCRRCRLAKDTLYRIVSSKETLVRDVVLGVLERHNASLSVLLQKPDGVESTLARSSALLATLVDTLSPDVLAEVFAAYPGLEADIEGRMGDSLKQLRVYLEQASAGGVLLPDLDADLVVRVLHACALEFVKHPNLHDARKDGEALARYLLEGIKRTDGAKKGGPQASHR